MKVVYEGRDISDSVEMSSCTYDCREMGRLPELRCEFRDADGKWGRWRPKAGDSIEISDAGGPPTGRLYVRSVRPSSGTMELVAWPLKSPPGSHTRTFRNASFRAVASRLAADLGLSLELHGTSGPPFKRFEQRGMRDLDALARLCALSGCLIDAYGGKLHLYGRAWAESRPPSGTVSIDAADRMEWRDEPRLASLELVQEPNYDWKPESWTQFETGPKKASFEGTQSVDGGVTATGAYKGEQVKFRPEKEADRRDALSATARGAGSGSESLVLPEDVWFATSAAMRTAAGNLLAWRNAERAWGSVEQQELCEYTPGCTVEVECPDSPMVGGRAIVTRVRNDYAGGNSKIWWRPL